MLSASYKCKTSWSASGILKMSDVLELFKDSYGPLKFSIDGGAGWGDTATTLANYSDINAVIHAFEPFSKNHRFFDELDKRIRLHKCALSDHKRHELFIMPSRVTSNNQWSNRGLDGYSSLGYLSKRPMALAYLSYLKQMVKAASVLKFNDMPSIKMIECVSIDQQFAGQQIDFVKLDLQGGEFDALRGATVSMPFIRSFFVEFTGDFRVIDILNQFGFACRATNFMTIGISKGVLKEHNLVPISDELLSNGRQALISKCGSSQVLFRQVFESLKSHGFVQTDIFALRKDLIHEIESKL